MMTDPDVQFFTEHPSRQARIRLPVKTPHRDQQRAVRYLDECEIEFRHLGGHDPKRRRIIAYKLPADHPSHPNHIMKIPFLAFTDETIRDDDETLIPIVHEIMVGEAMK
jgi:hypothetical protein